MFYLVFTPDHFFTGEPTVTLITTDLDKAVSLANAQNQALKPHYQNFRVVTIADLPANTQVQ